MSRNENELKTKTEEQEFRVYPVTTRFNLSERGMVEHLRKVNNLKTSSDVIRTLVIAACQVSGYKPESK